MIENLFFSIVSNEFLFNKAFLFDEICHKSKKVNWLSAHNI